jgi:ubiquinol-cytochrome c reductase cytochrome b subunit
MHYCGSAEGAFGSVVALMQEVNGGYILRAVHANGASMIFISLYVHVRRGLYAGSFNNHIA